MNEFMEVDKEGTRQRFYIELKPGETTIVSWKKLLKDAASKGRQSPSSPPSPPPPPSSAPLELDAVPVVTAQQYHESQFALEEYFQVDKSTTKHTGFFATKGKLEDINESISPTYCQSKERRKSMPKAPKEKVGDNVCNVHEKLGHVGMNAVARNTPLVEPFSNNSLAADSEHRHNGKSLHSLSSLNDTEKQIYGVLHSRDQGKKVKGTREFSGATHQKYQEKNATNQLQSQSKRLKSDAINVDCRGNKKAKPNLPDLNIPHYPIQPAKTATMHPKNDSSLRSRGTMLERAIRDLEKMVAKSRPRNMEVQDGRNSAMTIKRRLPPEVKQKLAKVARVAQSGQGKISEDLIDRLMGILGHLVQLRTLKRNLREMVLMGLSTKREKADRFQQIKMEVIEMIKLQASKQRDKAVGNSQQACAQEENGAVKVKYSMDQAMEDKICDLYDLYVQGMHEDSGPQIRKLYIELAELWPNGAMDYNGIKNAICRAKDRKKAFCNDEKVQEKVRRKRFPTAEKEDNVCGKANSIVQAEAVQERPTTKYNNHIFASYGKSISTSATINQCLATRPIRLSPSYSEDSNNGFPKQVKLEKTTLPLMKEETQ